MNSLEHGSKLREFYIHEALTRAVQVWKEAEPD